MGASLRASEEEELLRSVALQNATAVLRARQKADQEQVQAKQRAEKLALDLAIALRRALLAADVAKALTGVEPLKDPLSVCAAAIVRHLDAVLAQIWTPSLDGPALELQVSAGLGASGGESDRLPSTDPGAIAQVAEERVARLSNAAQSDPELCDPAWAAREGVVGFAALPLLAKDRLLGVLAVFSKVALPADTLEALASVADVVVLGIERRRADAERAETEHRNASILEASMDCIVGIDARGYITAFNAAAERTFQYDSAAVLGHEMAVLLVPPAWREQHRQGLKRYAETGRSAIFGKRLEMAALRADGTEFPVELSITPVAGGGSTAFTGFLRDITARRAAEVHRAKLLELEQVARASLATTLRSIADAVIATDDAGCVTFMNPVAEALTGWPVEEALGRPLAQVFRLVDALSRKEVESPSAKALRHGVVVGLAGHTALIARDGKSILVEDSAAPIHDDAGALTGVVLVFRDVTAQKAASDRKEFLAEAMTALATVLDVHKTLGSLARLAVPKLADWCTIDVVGEDGVTVQQITVAHADPARVALAEELGKRYPPSPNAKSGSAHVLRTGESELYPEISDELLIASAVDAEHLRIARALQLRSALVVPLKSRGRTLAAMTFVMAESGRHYTLDDLQFAEEFARRAALAVDNARLYESEQTARQNADRANRAKDDFLATVSHELRTPLNVMLGWTRMLRAGELAGDKVQRALETIERNAVTQTQLIEDLLDVSRIVSGKLRLDVQSVELSHIVEQAVEALRLASESRNVRLLMALDENAGPIMGDPHRLQQVVWNLVSNAIKFTPKGGRVHIAVERVDSNLMLNVSDDGRGIEAEFLPHVFERFKQADGATTRAYGGLGLGLAISRHIVELHGGSISVKSGGKGMGATFQVLLPISPVRSSYAPSRRRTVEGAGTFASRPELNGLKVLLVEDEEDARELLVAILNGCGAIVLTATSASDALAQLRAHKPDVLVSDIGLPGEDGYSLIRKVRALSREEGGAIPAAALTAYARAEDRRQAMDAGFMMHLSKPVEPAELLAVVANLTRFGPRH